MLRPDLNGAKWDAYATLIVTATGAHSGSVHLANPGLVPRAARGTAGEARAAARRGLPIGILATTESVKLTPRRARLAVRVATIGGFCAMTQSESDDVRSFAGR